MWRDVFLNNREAVLEVLGRFDDDLTALRKAIRNGDGQKLFDVHGPVSAARSSSRSDLRRLTSSTGRQK
jgi:cyclohexadieny/prephenate dehydrogenase